MAHKNQTNVAFKTRNSPSPSTAEIARERRDANDVDVKCGTGKRRMGVGGHALVSGCPEPWTIQP